MPIPITIPRLGWNMEEGVFVGWLKRDGDEIKPGDSIFSLESEKATEDVECLDGGILRIGASYPKAGESVRVGDLIGYLLQPGEVLPAEAQPESMRALTQTVGWAESSRATTSTFSKTAGLEHSTHPKDKAIAISPRARRVAAQLGIDWKNLQGSGRTGRIREQDVRAAAERPSASGVASAPRALASGVASAPRRLHGGLTAPAQAANAIPVSSIRRTIAERLRHSLSTTAPVTLTTTADAQNLVNLRDRFKTDNSLHAEAASFTDLFVRLVAIALQSHPRLNSRWEGNRILEMKEINIGIAIDTEAGLVAPVVRNVSRLALEDIVRLTRDLIDRARRGKLHQREMEGGTFTISNLGPFGIDAFTPIINWPECTVLGVGRIRRQPVVTDEGIVAREQVTLSLTFDHRIVDGADAAGFLQSLVKLVEQPDDTMI
jgi:pyruvate dehydrogenase E2 component (dihydrolipoamide acetyltransferase)